MQTPVTVSMGSEPNPMTTDVKLRLLPAAAAVAAKDKTKFTGTLPDITLQLPRTTTIAELESGLQTTLPGMLDASRSWLARRLHPRHACGPLHLLVSTKSVKLEQTQHYDNDASDAAAVTTRGAAEGDLVPLPGQATLEYLLARRSEETASDEAAALELYFQEEGKYGFIDDDLCLLCCTGLCCCCEGLLLGSLMADSNKPQQQPQQPPIHQNNEYYYYQNGQPTGPAPLPPNNNYYTGNSYGVPPSGQPVYPPPLYPPQQPPPQQPVYGQPIYYNQPPPAPYPPGTPYTPQPGKPTAL